jgi:hypothetical protein
VGLRGESRERDRHRMPQAVGPSKRVSKAWLRTIEAKLFAADLEVNRGEEIMRER